MHGGMHGGRRRNPLTSISRDKDSEKHRIGWAIIVSHQPKLCSSVYVCPGGCVVGIIYGVSYLGLTQSEDQIQSLFNQVVYNSASRILELY